MMHWFALHALDVQAIVMGALVSWMRNDDREAKLALAPARVIRRKRCSS